MFQRGADEIITHRGDGKPEDAHAAAKGIFRYSHKGEQSPDLPLLKNEIGHKGKHIREHIFAEHIHHKNEHIRHDNVPHQARDTPIMMFVAKTIHSAGEFFHKKTPFKKIVFINMCDIRGQGKAGHAAAFPKEQHFSIVP